MPIDWKLAVEDYLFLGIDGLTVADIVSADFGIAKDEVLEYIQTIFGWMLRP